MECKREKPEHSKTRPNRVHWNNLKTNPGAIGLESILFETDKLRILSQLALPADLFQEVSPSVVRLYRERAATDTVYELRRHPDATRSTYLAAFCQPRAGGDH
jgi:hypothetical protein